VLAAWSARQALGRLARDRAPGRDAAPVKLPQPGPATDPLP
jgi:hypothetical protein